jgi:hypothetical protein
MSPIVATILATVGKSLLAMLMSLLTERFLKKSIIAVLEELADKTQSDLDNKLLAAAKEAWGDESDASK